MSASDDYEQISKQIRASWKTIRVLDADSNARLIPSDAAPGDEQPGHDFIAVATLAGSDHILAIDAIDPEVWGLQHKGPYYRFAHSDAADECARSAICVFHDPATPSGNPGNPRFVKL